MSSGAELAVVGAPVGVLAVGLLAATAGVVIVGGVALVGVGRLGLAAGSYLADRMRERERACASEYTRYQQLRAAALRARASVQPAQRALTQPVEPAADHTPSEVYHQDAQVATMIAERLAADLREREARYEWQLHLGASRSQLMAALQVGGDLPADVVMRGKEALARAADVAEALTAVRAARQHTAAAVLEEHRAALLEQEQEIDTLITAIESAEGRHELRQWRAELVDLRYSPDEQLLDRRRREGAALIERWRTLQAAERAEQYAAALAELWGQLQAVGALLSDLETLALAGELSLDPALIARFHDLAARYEAIETNTADAPRTVRKAAGELRRELAAIERDGRAVAEAHYRRRISDEIEVSLRAITFDDAPFAVVREEKDGQVRLRARQGKRTLDVRLRRDGTIGYHARGFGDERCLEAVYRLIDELIDRGVKFEHQHPRLMPRNEIALRVIEAIKQLEHYRDDQITVVSEDEDAIVIEAGRADQPGYHRVTVRDEEISEEQVAELLARPASEPAAEVEHAVNERKAKVRNRHPRLDRHAEEQRLGR